MLFAIIIIIIIIIITHYLLYTGYLHLYAWSNPCF